MVQRGRRAVYEPEANAFEKATPTNEDEYRRKVRMFEHCWAIVVEGKMLRRLRPLYLLEVLSHRHLRYASGVLHLVAARHERSRCSDTGPCTRSRLGCSSACCSPRSSASASPDTTCSSRGRRSSRSGTTCAAVCRRRGSRGGDALNRAADVAIAGAALVVASPLLGLAALAIKLEDRGPVLYRQTRVGKDGSDFELLKLRTMVVGAETMGAGYRSRRRRLADHARRPRPAPALARRAAAALERDPRRHEHVGPRPTLRYQVERYDARQARRLDVKPGITGWAQVHGRASLPWPERIELDVWYVEHRSPSLDLKILAAYAARALQRDVQGRDGRLAARSVTEPLGGAARAVRRLRLRTWRARSSGRSTLSSSR